MSLTPVQLHALTVAGKPASKVRDKLVAGKTYRIDLTVRIHGTLVVGHPEQVAVDKKACPKQLLAAVLSNLGPRKRKSLVDELIASNEKPDPKAVQEAERLIRETAKTTMQNRRGAVTGKLTAEPI
ncbi:hypothetical protein [Crateriforma conspicua]|uniref:Uncharacterized protein n=1 Tax=Crateriforma conspicua TaxID=2527996 RepID=A0A5C6FTW9_9PLAN|nr:hypothetical protein [Crateriforma conspicua]TWU66457.1 hypothetical protein V7x_20230 [Crateriforma conspicua]